MSYPHLPRSLQKLAENSEAQQMEFATSAFWQVACQIQFPLNEDYICVCEQAVDTSLKRVDLKVEYLFPYADSYAPILIVEIKRSGTSLRDLEHQVRDYALRQIAQRNLTGLYVQTVRGLTYRHWYVADGFMRAIEGRDHVGLKEEYVDVKTSAGWTRWQRATHAMKAAHPVAHAPVLPSQQHAVGASAVSVAGPGPVSQVAGWEDAGPSTHFSLINQGAGKHGEEGQGDEYDENEGVDDEEVDDEEIDDDGDEYMDDEPRVAPEVDLTNARQVRLSSIRGGVFVFRNENGQAKRTMRKDWMKERDASGSKIWIYRKKGKVYWAARD